MTIYELKILFHYHVSPNSYGPEPGALPLFDNTISQFLKDGLICISSTTNQDWELTGKGKFYVTYLQTIPLPELSEPKYYIPEVTKFVL